jgi:subtilase family serine protease/pimeloyl-ACP methyl ester carboxylesterase
MQSPVDPRGARIWPKSRHLSAVLLALTIAASAAEGQTVLQNGVPLGGQSATTFTLTEYRIPTPTGATSLTVTTTGGSGNPDLFVRYAMKPTTTVYDCKSSGSGTQETCTIAVSPTAAISHYILLYATGGYSNVTITATYTVQTALSLSVSPTATVQYVARGGSLTFTTTVKDVGGQPVSGATVSGSDGLRSTSFSVPTNTSGVASYTTTASSTATGCYNLTFTASKSGFANSAQQTRQVCILLPDFAITSVVGPTGSSTSVFLVDVNLQNLGNTPTPTNTPLNIYLSTDQVITTADRVVLATTVSAIAAGQPHKISQLVDVGNVPFGPYYWGAIVDPANTVAESNESNNLKLGGSFQWPAGQADLTPTSITTTQSSWTVGSSAPVSVTTANVGTGSAAGGWQGQIYLSTDQTITGADIPICVYSESRTTTTSTPLTNSFSCPLPTSVGANSYYLGVIVNSTGSLSEISLNNNRVASTTQITVQGPPLPNLVVAAPSSGLTVNEGQSFNLVFPVSNIGRATSSATTLEVRLNGVVRGTGQVPALAAGAPAANVSVALPALTAATYSGSATVDPASQVPEENDGDNTRTFVLTVVQSGQLEVTAYNERGALAGSGITLRLYDGNSAFASLATDGTSKVLFTGLDPSRTYRLEMSGRSPENEFWAVCGPYTVPLNTLRAEACARNEPWIESVIVDKDFKRQDARGRPIIEADGLKADIEVTLRNATPSTRDVDVLASFPTTSGEYYGQSIRRITTIAPGGTAKVVFPFAIPQGSETNVGIVLDVRATNITGSALRTSYDATSFGFRTVSNCSGAYRLEMVSAPGAVASPLRDLILVHGYNGVNDGGPLKCGSASSDDVANEYWGARAGAASLTDWNAFRTLLEQNGTRVWTYRWPSHESIEAAGNNLREKLLSATSGVGQNVVLVGHSMGGLVSLQSLVSGSGLRSRVRRLVTLGTPHDGLLYLAPLATCQLIDVSCQEIDATGSGAIPPYIAALNAKKRASDDAMTFLLGGYSKDTRYAGFCLGVNLGILNDCVVDLASALGTATFPRSQVVVPTGGARQSDPYGFADYDHGDIKWDWRSSDVPYFDRGIDLKNALQKLLLTDFGGSPSTQTLVVLGTASTSARVTSLPAGIDCPIVNGTSTSPSCSYDFSVGSLVKLSVQGGASATWSSGSAGFSCPLGPDCTVTMTTSRSVTVNVAPLATALRVASAPSGAESGRPFTTQPAVQVVDGAGAPVSQSGVAVTASVQSGAGSLVGVATAQTNASGLATFTSLGLTGIGNHTLSFSAPSLSNTTSSLTVAPVTLSDGVLLSGQTAPAGAELHYKIAVPPGQTSADFVSTGGTGNADLYVRFGQSPTTTQYDCKSTSSNSAELCSRTAPAAGDWYMMLISAAGFSGVQVVADYRASAVQITTPFTLPGAAVSTLYTQPLVATGGTGSYTWSVEPGGPLPSWLALNPSTGVLTGTPTAVANHTFSIRATSGAASDVRQFTLAVTGSSQPILTAAPASWSPSVPESKLVNVTQSIQITNTGGGSLQQVDAQVTFLQGSGWLSATPSGTSGNITLTLDVNHFGLTPGQYAANVVVSALGAQPLTIPVTLTVTARQRFTLTVVAGVGNGRGNVIQQDTDGSPSIYCQIDNGKTSPQSTCTSTYLDGDIAQLGPEYFDINDIDRFVAWGGACNGTSYSICSVTMTGNMTVSAAWTAASISVSGSGNGAGRVTGGGIDCAIAAGVASGPTCASIWHAPVASLDLTATANAGSTLTTWGGDCPAGTATSCSLVPVAGAVLAATVKFDALGSTLAITTPATLPGAIEGQGYTEMLTASGGSGTYTWTISGSASPPSGISLAPNGSLQGIPSVAGTSQFTVTVSDGSASASKLLTLNVEPVLRMTSPVTVPSGVVGSPYSYQLLATGGAGTYSWSLAAGPPPPGLSLSATGLLSGIPTASGSFDVPLELSSGMQLKFVQISVPVTTAPVIDLVAGAPSVTPGTPTASQPVTVNATVINGGNSVATGVVWQLKIDGYVIGSGSIATLAVGASVPVTATSSAPFASGSHTAQLVVDPPNLIAESSETNNTSAQAFTVVPTPVIDLVAGPVAVSPSTPTASQVVTLTSTVTNSGNTVATGVAWQLRVDGTVIGSGTLATLAAGASAPVSATSATAFATGNRSAQLIVDPTDLITESDESNNTRTQGFTVIPTPVIDLVATPLTISPSAPTANQTVSLSAAVTNSGNTAATNVNWQLKVDGAVIGSGTLTSLAAGASAPVSATSSSAFATGGHTAQLLVDPADLIPETNETNNSSVQGFTVSPTPVIDLVAGPLMISPSAPTSGQLVTLSATVSNSGNTAATGVAWQLRVDGAVVGGGTLATLAAGASVSVTATTTTTLSTGAHSAQLLVDPANLITESIETNNASAQSFTVTPPPIVDVLAGALAVTPSTPTSGQSVVLSATVSNGGNTTATGVAWQLKVDGSVIGSGTIANIAAGTSVPVSATSAVTFATGSHSAQLVVDPANLIVESNENNNTSAQGFTVIPKPVIDLVAGTLSVTPAAPTSSQTVTLSASVSNGGSTAAAGVAWQLKIDGAVVGSGTISTLAAGASTQVTATSANALAVGSHAAQLVVDPANIIGESNETNNASGQSFSVSPTPVIDLVADPITVTPNAPTTAQLIKLSASVSNAGNSSATGVTWQLKIDGSVVGSGTIATLAAGASTAVSATSTVPFATGTHGTQLVVDAANLINESNETNNTSAQGFTVSPTPVIDLVAGTLALSPNAPTASQPITLSTTISNSGNATATSVAWQVKVDGSIIGSGTLATLAAGASAPIVVSSATAFATGPHSAQLTVDPANLISESTRNNNTSTLDFTVRPTPVIDLVAGAVTITPAAPAASQPLQISGTVSNIGNTAATGVAWQLRVDGTVVGSGTLATLAAGASSQVTASIGSGLANGRYAAQLTVDPANLIVESNENNNSSAQGFTVGPTPALDLVAGQVTIAPSSPTATQPVTLTASVSNIGNTAATGVTWQLKVDGAVIGSGTIATVASSATVPVSATTPAGVAPGSHTAQLLVDPSNQISETNEANNASTASFSVSPEPLANLVADAVLSVSPTTPTTADQLTIRASVRNAGGRTAPTFSWRLSVDSDIVRSGTAPALPVGEVFSLTIEGLGPLAAGRRTLLLGVDYDNRVPESDENDNSATRSLEIATPPSTCTLTLGTVGTGGTVALTQGSASGPCERTVTFVASPSTSYRFVAWSDGSDANPRTLKLDQPTLTLNASFQFSPAVQAIADRIIDRLLKGTGDFTPQELTFIDSQGNQNGAVDVGDLLALVQKNPSVALSQQLLLEMMSSPHVQSIRIPSAKEKKP